MTVLLTGRSAGLVEKADNKEATATDGRKRPSEGRCDTRQVCRHTTDCIGGTLHTTGDALHAASDAHYMLHIATHYTVHIVQSVMKE